MKKIFLLLLISVLLLAACSSKSDSGKKESTGKDDNVITVWAWDPNFNIAALNIAKEFYDGKEEIKIVENAQDDIVQKLNTGLSSGTLKGLPNIVLIEDYRAQSFLKAYPDAFFPLTDYINPKDFADYKIKTTSFNGKQYGLPFDTGVTGLYIRTDYIKEAGYTVEDFTNITWDQFVEMGKVIKEKTGKYMLTLDPNDLGQIRMMIQTAGKWYLKEDGATPDLAENSALKEAFQIYKKMYESGIAKTVTDWSQFVGAFNSGDVVSVPSGNWLTPSIKAEKSQSGKWAVVPIPRLSAENAVNASNLGGSSWYVLNLPGKEKAAEFLAKTFGSNVDFYQKLVSEVGAIGTYLPATKGENYTKGDEFFGGQPIISDFSKWLEEVPSVNYGMHTYAIEDILVNEMQNYLNGKDLDKVLQDAQKQAESQLH
ncbi:MAG: ABC transporter substrate-binding protein [Caldibacillus debilis]|uniref:ABC transporter substrate-binding protein n=1 Tax=Caldibacillus debilis TaxID=301148 RepID=A0A3E0JYW6_9BACI|nr:extracellular solute-binding protein [Caldibacillus debilis]REJ25570.1 MAG: ABC transporter substrate-binding protein [Caldibacillus debilis]